MAKATIRKVSIQVAPIEADPGLVNSVDNKNIIVLTPLQYAKLRGISLQLVCRRLKEGKLHSKTLRGIKSFAVYGRFYLLTVDQAETVAEREITSVAKKNATAMAKKNAKAKAKAKL